MGWCAWRSRPARGPSAGGSHSRPADRRDSEPERHAGARAPEVEAAEAQVERVAAVFLQAAEVAHVAADPDVVAEEDHHPAARVDAKTVLSQVEEIIDVIELAADQPRAAGHIGAHAATGLSADRDADDYVPHQGGDVPAYRGDFIVVEEVRGVAEVDLEPEHAGAHESERAAEIDGVLIGVAADVGSDIRREKPVRARLRGNRQCRGENESKGDVPEPHVNPSMCRT